MILPKYLHGFAVHVFKFIWRSDKCFMCEPFVTRQTSIWQSNSVQTDLSISLSKLATAVVMRFISSFKLTEVEERKLCLWYTPTRRNHKELSLDFLEGDMSVPCSQLLIGQSNVVVDFHPGNVEPHCASEAELHVDEYEVSTTLTVLILRKVECLFLLW